MQEIKRLRKHYRGLFLLALILVMSSFGGLCGTLQPAANPEHPRAAQPLQPETKEYFCRQLGLANDHPVCQPNRDAYVADLVPVLEERFPVNQTPYSEVADLLQDYPVQVEESKLPDVTVTSKRFAYLLTEYDGFCVYFSIRDVQSEIVARISSTSIGSGPTRDTCTSSEVRAQPRPWQLK
ncbi:hypothetical protein ANAEL_03536 [Anaerolineales bacterium]|nr:hypothetical protein ANAEL_03536 [Anaerolineales bacterium]